MPWGWPVSNLSLAVLILVSAVVLLRISAVRSPRQLPLWLMLVVQDVGIIAGLPPVSAAINDVSGVPQLADLIKGLCAVALATALLSLATHLHSAEREGPPPRRRLRFTLAAVTVSGQVACFCLAIGLHARLRPGFLSTPGEFSVVTAYWLFFLPYMITARFWSTILFWRTLPRVRSFLPRAGIFLLGLSTSVSLVYLGSRVFSLFSASAVLLDVSFYASATAFALLGLGGSLAALEPVRRAILDWYHSQLLYSLWHDLCAVVPQIALQPARGRLVDALTLRNNRLRLHRRLVEIRDGLLVLREWITPEDLEDIHGVVSETELGGDDAEAVITALWVRSALHARQKDLPRSPVMLDLVRRGGSDVRGELRWLLLLARAYRTSADRLQGDAPALAKDGTDVK
jgi:hypothetical protein